MKNLKFLVCLFISYCLATLLLAGEKHLTADFRYRYEADIKNTQDQPRDRQRIRARLGVQFLHDKLSAGLRLVTNSEELQSPHQTLGTGDATDNSGLGLDRAYLRLTPIANAQVTMGKAGANWWHQNEVFFDDDLSPEGLALSMDLGPVRVNLAHYLNNEADWIGLFGDASFGWAQGVYSAMIGSLGLAVTGGYAFMDSVTIGSEQFAERTVLSLTGQVKAPPGTIGLDFLLSNAEADNFSLVAMVKAKLSDYDLGLWYYQVGANSTLHAGYSQDNFPASVGFTGFRLQVGFKLFETVSTDIHYYFQTMDGSEETTSRFQTNFNIKF